MYLTQMREAPYASEHHASAGRSGRVYTTERRVQMLGPRQGVLKSLPQLLAPRTRQRKQTGTRVFSCWPQVLPSSTQRMTGEPEGHSGGSPVSLHCILEPPQKCRHTPGSDLVLSGSGLTIIESKKLLPRPPRGMTPGWLEKTTTGAGTAGPSLLWKFGLHAT